MFPFSRFEVLHVMWDITAPQVLDEDLLFTALRHMTCDDIGARGAVHIHRVITYTPYFLRSLPCQENLC